MDLTYWPVKISHLKRPLFPQHSSYPRKPKLCHHMLYKKRDAILIQTKHLQLMGIRFQTTLLHQLSLLFFLWKNHNVLEFQSLTRTNLPHHIGQTLHSDKAPFNPVAGQGMAWEKCLLWNEASNTSTLLSSNHNTVFLLDREHHFQFQQ